MDRNSVTQESKSGSKRVQLLHIIASKGFQFCLSTLDHKTTIYKLKRSAADQASFIFEGRTLWSRLDARYNITKYLTIYNETILVWM